MRSNLLASLILGSALVGAQGLALAQSTPKAASQKQSASKASKPTATATKKSGTVAKSNRKAQRTAKPAATPATVPAAAVAAPAAAGALIGGGDGRADAAAMPVNNEINPHKFALQAGTYSCDLDRKVLVREVAPDMATATLNWAQKDYTLRAVPARTGALRYEDPASGLVWLVIVGKSMLLDTRQGQQLANDCKA